MQCILTFWIIGLFRLSSEPPNVIIILVDDMGYSDIGCYGAEIKTPVLDRLASEGVRFSQFYNAAKCCPSRAAFLTGVYPHQAGMGSMTDTYYPIPEYQGYLNRETVTLAEVLGNEEYSTYISGKWHVGTQRGKWPVDRGFDRSFAFIHGAGSFFDFEPYRSADWPLDKEVHLVEGDEIINDRAPKGYATDIYTDEAIRFIQEHSVDNPFFLYLAYTAPHWPMHALPEDIQKYEGMYDAGWDSIRYARFQKLKKQGLIPEDSKLPIKDPRLREWEDLTDAERARESRLMEVYAAMIDRVDQNVGRLLETLEAEGHSDNTVIFFLSDNGAATAGNLSLGKFIDDRFDPEALPGTPDSFTGYGRDWASVSNTPFSGNKGMIHEGGIATPFIAWYPREFKAGQIVRQVGHITDLMPTICELAGVEYPNKFNGYKIKPYQGISLVQALQGKASPRDRPLFFEHTGNRGYIADGWKLVARNEQPWELYRLDQDRAESNDLSASHSDQLKDMKAIYRDWETENRILPWSEVLASNPIQWE